MVVPNPSALRAPPASGPAFADVFREHAPFAWRCLRRLGVAEKDADDVCQEVFLVVLRRLPDFREGEPPPSDRAGAESGQRSGEGSSMRAWIYGICVRKASEHRRTAYQRRESAVEAPPDRGMDAPQGQALENKRALEFLDRTLAGLDDDKRAVFVLYEIEGLTMNEIAGALECPLQTAYSRLHAARKIVEEAFARERARRSA